MGEFVDGNVAACEGNLRDSGSRNEEFAFLHAETAADQESDRPGAAIDQKIVNDAEMLFAVIDFVTGDGEGAADVRISGSETVRRGTAAHQVLPANGDYGAGGRQTFAFGARQRDVKDAFFVVYFTDRRRAEQRGFVKARRMLRSHDMSNGPVLVVEIKVDDAAGKTVAR